MTNEGRNTYDDSLLPGDKVDQASPRNLGLDFLDNNMGKCCSRLKTSRGKCRIVKGIHNGVV